MMRATGILFMSNTAPVGATAADGTFCVTLLAMDRIGPHQVEPWRITWVGRDAYEFWCGLVHDLKPGQPISVELERIRTFTNGRNGGPEIHAVATSIRLAPHARANIHLVAQAA